jgi:hypothetical protein
VADLDVAIEVGILFSPREAGLLFVVVVAIEVGILFSPRVDGLSSSSSLSET